MKQYSLWSNYRFAYEPLWKHKKRLLVVTVAEAVFVVFVPIVGMAVTSMIVGSLERGTPMRELVCQILAAFVGYGILSMIKGYLEARGGEQYIEARTEFFIMQEIEKDLSVSMEQYEDSSVHTLKEKADYGLWSNDYGIEGF
ncbi:MAG: hypothetical protein K2O99_02525, partial [Lachnospiraceae bacterium]|nr:hypothetical protein [Lachnospiraceae bacterium]